MKASEGKARVRPVQSKAKEGPKSVPSPSSLKRSGTVEGLLGNTEQENISYDEVFKTRNKVIDDRSITPSSLVNSPPKKPLSVPAAKSPTETKRLQDVDGFLDYLYQKIPGSSQNPRLDPNINLHSFANTFDFNSRSDATRVDAPLKKPAEASLKKVAWGASNSNTPLSPNRQNMIGREIAAFSTITSPTNNGNNNMLLKSTSEIFLLPEVEAKYLDQYSIDASHLKQVTSKVDQLSKKIKEISKFIKAKVMEEEQYLTPHALKIQSWYRGAKCRKDLIAKNHKIFDRSRFYPDLKKANTAATLIQANWRGHAARSKYELQLLKEIMKNQRKEMAVMKNNLEKQQHEINELRKLINSMLKKDNVDELESPENFAS